MASNIAQFENELQSEIDLNVRRFVELHRTMLQAGMSALRGKSPVWSGRYRASHRIGIGAPDTSVAPPYGGPEVWPEPVSPGAQISAPAASGIALQLSTLQPFQLAILSNSVDYAGIIENGDSGRAPRNVYELTAQEIEQRFRNVKI